MHHHRPHFPHFHTLLGTVLLALGAAVLLKLLARRHKQLSPVVSHIQDTAINPAISQGWKYYAETDD